jgi:hypothetical protein
MHDIDRSLFEAGEELEAHEYEAGGETEALEQEDFLGILGSILGESGQELQEGEAEGPSQELQEVELATELLEVSNEAELEQFLGSLLSRVVGGARDLARSPVGQAVGGALRSTVKRALPGVGRAVGDWVAPGRGGDVGSRVGTAAADLFGLELEGLTSEDREFEVARSFVRFADAACRNAASAPPDAPPQAVAQAALTAAARQHAPGLLQVAQPATPPGGQGYGNGNGRPRSGRWVRRGQVIVIEGL